MKRKLSLLFAFLLATPLYAADVAGQRAEILDLAKLTTAPAMEPAKGFSAPAGLQPIFFDALPWKGKPTKVFAWLGLPEKRTGKVPGVVLVHGGGGTAFQEWVKKWNDHGFAAISIAVEGQTDQIDPSSSKGKRVWKQHAWAGPKRDGIYGDSAKVLTEQWMYHAVAQTVLANSLMRSLPEVEASQVGLMGISWGGVITSTVMGIDARFAFAIPTYGCGHLFDSENQYGRSLANNTLYREAWDPMQRMARVAMPVLWLSWPQDEHFPLNCQAACYQAAPGPHMVSLIPAMGHGGPAGWNPPDSYAFAESVVRDGAPWCRQTGLEVKDNALQVTFTSAKPLESAVLTCTVDHGFTGNRHWIESPASLEKRGDGWIVTAPLGAGTTAWYVNVRSGKLTASSDYQERPR